MKGVFLNGKPIGEAERCEDGVRHSRYRKMQTPCPGCGADMFATSWRADNQLAGTMFVGTTETVEAQCMKGCEVKVVGNGNAHRDGLPLGKEAREAFEP